MYWYLLCACNTKTVVREGRLLVTDLETCLRRHLLLPRPLRLARVGLPVMLLIYNACLVGENPTCFVLAF